MCQGDQNDYYYFNLNVLHHITVDLTGIPDGADYDLILYDPSQTIVAQARRSGNVDEHISYVPAVTGRYYIRVWPYVEYSDTTPYRLVATFE